MQNFNPELNVDRETGTYIARSASTPRPLTASAVRLNLKDPRESNEFIRRITRKNSWQSQAWDYYDYIGEIKFSANLIANYVSKINIFPAYVTTQDSVPSAVRHHPDVEEYLPLINEIFSLLNTGIGGVSGYLRTAALCQFIAGEHYLVCEPGNPVTGRPERYSVRSTDEIYTDKMALTPSGRPQVFIKPEPDSDKDEYIPLPDGTYISRMWRSHPRFSAQADSALRGILDDADDLLTYSREGRILSRSRSSASLLFIPDSLDDSAYPDDPTQDPEAQDGSDDAHDSLAEYISQALNEAAFQDEHVNHYAPIILRGPADAGDGIRFIDLSRPMDNLHSKMVDDKLDRILNALDIPKDLAKGLSDLKYNSGALIEDSLYNSHVEPLILLLVDQLTSAFLRPALRANGVPEEIISKVVVWYNPSAIMAKPTKSQAANFGYENHIISGAAWRDANGFTTSDQPTQTETGRRLLIDKVVLDPALTNALISKILPELMESARGDSSADRDPNAMDAFDAAMAGTSPTPLSGDPADTEIELDPAESEQVMEEFFESRDDAPTEESDEDEDEDPNPTTPTGLIEP